MKNVHTETNHAFALLTLAARRRLSHTHAYCIRIASHRHCEPRACWSARGRTRQVHSSRNVAYDGSRAEKEPRFPRTDKSERQGERARSAPALARVLDTFMVAPLLPPPASFSRPKQAWRKGLGLSPPSLSGRGFHGQAFARLLLKLLLLTTCLVDLLARHST